MSTLALPARFDMGRAITNSFSVYGRNFVRLIGLAFVLNAVPAAIFRVAQTQIGVDSASSSPGVRIPLAVLLDALLVLSAISILLFCAAALQIAVVRTAIGDLSGRRPELGDLGAAALRDSLPVIGLLILLGLGVALGFVLLIVPGVILALAWSVAIPARVVEGPSVTRAFGRSADLTRNHRGAILVVWLVCSVASWIIQAVVAGVLAGVFGAGFLAAYFTGGAGAEGYSGAYWAALAGRAISGALLGSVGAVVSAAVYFELRGGKEGVGFEQVADVFS